MDGNKSEAKVAWLFNLATQRHSRNLDPTFLTCKLCCKIPKEEEHEAGEEQDRGQKNAQVLEELLSKQSVAQQKAKFLPQFHIQDATFTDVFSLTSSMVEWFGRSWRRAMPRVVYAWRTSKKPWKNYIPFCQTKFNQRMIAIDHRRPIHMTSAKFSDF